MSDEKWLFTLPPADLKAAEKKFKDRNPIWTGCKAKLIERYLYYFVMITRTGNYIDAFAGPQETEKLEMWSAKLVLESNPRWLKKFFLFDNAESQIACLRKLVNSQLPRSKEKKEPLRKVEIYHGDFNEQIHEMFASHPIREKEPTFCLLDQRTFECDWDSVKVVANQKTSGNKIELFYFFPEGWINRSIAALKIDREEKLNRWWGNNDWQSLLKVSGTVRARLVADRVKSELKYKHVYPFPIYEKKDEGGRVMYYMIHASDHDEASGLMSRAYGKALDIKEGPEQLDFLSAVVKH